MNSQTFYKMLDWRFKDYQYVSDLIDYDGPILVHYQLGKNHALFLWVEGTAVFNRWLCFELTLKELKDYMLRNISLYELIKSKSNEPFYTVDIDSNLKYHNFQLIPGYGIPEDYLPERDSHFLDDVSDYYQTLFNAFSQDNYVQHLRDNGIDLKIQTNETYKKRHPYHDGTLTFESGSVFLRCINESYKGFVSIMFYNEFKNDISDSDTLIKTTNRILEVASPRIADVKQNSFQVTLGIDSVLRPIDIDPKYIKFVNTLSERFSKEILSMNLNNEKDVKIVLERFTEIQRKKIFAPLIKLINRPECDLVVLEKKNNVRREFTKVNHANKISILPQKQTKDDLPEELKKIFATITVEVNEGEDLRNINFKKLFQENLFTEFSDEKDFQLPKIADEKYEIIFHEPITYKLKIIDNIYHVYYEPLNIEIIHPIRKIALDGFVDAFIYAVDLDYISTGPKNKENQRFLHTIIKDVFDLREDN